MSKENTTIEQAQERLQNLREEMDLLLNNFHRETGLIFNKMELVQELTLREDSRYEYWINLEACIE